MCLCGSEKLANETMRERPSECCSLIITGAAEMQIRKVALKQVKTEGCIIFIFVNNGCEEKREQSLGGG